MMKRTKLALIAVLIPAALLLSTMSAIAADPFENLAAATALLAEIETGTILFESNSNTRHPADSLTKAMTILLAVIECENETEAPGDLVVMTETAHFDINTRSTTQNIRPGEEMMLIDLMYCAFVGNANEACNMIAEYISGSINDFITQMNAYAVSLGCLNTNFSTTHGQYNENQYTTAYDMFLIFREAMKHQFFAEIAGTYRYDTAATNRSATRRLASSNSLFISNNKYYYRPCTAGIASATFEGGYSLVSAAETNGLSLIAIVLGSDAYMHPDESVDLRNLTESRRLYEWGFSQFSWRIVLSSTDLIDKAPIINGAGADYVNLRPESSITALLDNDVLPEEFIRTITIYPLVSGEPLYAPIDSGEVLGEVTVVRNGINYGTVLLIANTSIELHRIAHMKMLILNMLKSKTARFIIWILVMLLLGYIALVIRHNMIRQKRLQEAAEIRARLMAERESEERERDRWSWE